MVASLSAIKILSQDSHRLDVQGSLACSGWMGLVLLQISSFKTLNAFFSLHHLDISLPSVLFLTSVCDHVKHMLPVLCMCSLAVYTWAPCLQSIAYEMFNIVNTELSIELLHCQ